MEAKKKKKRLSDIREKQRKRLHENVRLLRWY